MADISKVTIGGTTYNIKDEKARRDILSITNGVSGAMKFLGECIDSSNITTDDTYVVIYIKSGTNTANAYYSGTQPTETTYSYNGVNYAITYHKLEAGNVVISGTKEYVFSEIDQKWHEFGSTGSLKKLAFKDSASGTIKPKGSVSSTFTGSAKTVTHTVVNNGSVSASGTFKPAGTITQGTATTDNVVKSYPGSTSKLVKATVHDTPSTTKKGFTKSSFAKVPTVTTTKLAKTSITPVSGSVTASKASATSMSGVTASVTGETLVLTGTSISFTNVTVPKAATAVSVATGEVSSSGTGATLVSGVTAETGEAVIGLADGVTEVVTGLTAGSEIAVATGALSTSGTGATVLVGLGTATTSTVLKSVGNPTFTGTSATVSVTGTNSGITIEDHSITPSGTVSSTFNGTQESVTVS